MASIIKLLAGKAHLEVSFYPMEELILIQFIKCIFGFHRVIETHYCKDGELEVCHHCLKVVKK